MDKLLLVINSTSCALIAIRLMFYCPPPGAKYKPLISLIAYITTVAAGSVPIRAIFGEYPAHDISETVINLLLCVSIFASRGNVAKLWRVAAHG